MEGQESEGGIEESGMPERPGRVVLVVAGHSHLVRLLEENGDAQAYNMAMIY